MPARESVEPASLDQVIARLDREPGLFYACEAGVEGIHERGGWAFAGPPLALLLDGDRLTPLALDARGAALARRVPDAGTPIERLRGFLRTLPAESSVFGAWSGDYRRAILYVPDELLTIGADGTLTRGRFAFPPPEPGWRPPEMPRTMASRPGDDFGRGEYAPRVAQAVELLRRGDVASLVLSQSFRRRWDGSAAAAFQALRRANPNPVMFLARFPDGETLFGASPDMQLRLRDGIVQSAPVCGTLRRGSDPAEDADRLKALILSPKEESSLAACSDADLVDKATVCVPGSLELAARRRPMFLATILHTVDMTRGKVRPDADALDVLLAHVAPATIAGFPKATALRLIAELEASPRGWYGGAVMRLGADGSLDAGTILRAAAIRDGVAEIRTGGGLMPHSDPTREEEETYLKAEALFRALGLAPPAPPPSRVTARLAPPLAVELLADADPLGGLLADLLARIGAQRREDGIAVVSDPALLDVGRRKVLAIGEAAAALLGGDALPVAASASRVETEGVAGTFLAELGRVTLGVYARGAPRADRLPDGWTAAALDEDGRIVAAQRQDGSAAALCFRPDSVVSRKNDAGARAVVLALSHLHRSRET